MSEIIRETVDEITHVYKVFEVIDPKTKKKKIVKRLSHKEYTEDNDNGMYFVKEQKNGICVKLLKAPSDAYKAKMQARAEIEAQRQAEQDEKDAINKKIADKERQNAIDELLASGELTQDDIDRVGG